MLVAVFRMFERLMITIDYHVGDGTSLFINQQVISTLPYMLFYSDWLKKPKCLSFLVPAFIAGFVYYLKQSTIALNIKSFDFCSAGS